MTADLVARLGAYIAAREAMLGMDEVVNTCHSSGGSASISLTDLREAASALRSSGEAVAARVAHYGADKIGILLSDLPTGTPLYLHPATPTSAWRPIAEAPRDGTEILAWDGEDRFVTKWCTFKNGFGKSHTGWIEPNAGELGPWPCEPILFQPLPTPPTSTQS